jgi:hypothetical protein
MEPEQRIQNRYTKIRKNHSTLTIQAIVIFWEKAFTSLKKQNTPTIIAILKFPVKVEYLVSVPTIFIRCSYAKF